MSIETLLTLLLAAAITVTGLALKLLVKLGARVGRRVVGGAREWAVAPGATRSRVRVRRATASRSFSSKATAAARAARPRAAAAGTAARRGVVAASRAALRAGCAVGRAARRGWGALDRALQAAAAAADRGITAAEPAIERLARASASTTRAVARAIAGAAVVIARWLRVAMGVALRLGRRAAGVVAVNFLRWLAAAMLGTGAVLERARQRLAEGAPGPEGEPRHGSETGRPTRATGSKAAARPTRRPDGSRRRTRRPTGSRPRGSG